METTIQTHPRTALPPGPTHPLAGVNYLSQINNDLLSFLETMASYGDLSYTPVGYLRMYFANHPDLVHEILVTQGTKLPKWRTQRKIIGQVLGHGTFNIEGDEWKRKRKLVQPAFHAKRIQAYVETIVEETRHVISGWHDGSAYDMRAEMPKLTMAIISRIMFGADVYGHEAEVSHAMQVAMDTEAR